MLKLKLLGIGLISAILLAESPVSSAESKAIDQPIITPLDVQLISPFRYNSTNAYEKSFTLTPGDNGVNADIKLKNFSTTPVYMKIYKNNVLQLEVTFNSGTQKTVSIYQTVSSDYRIYVYNRVGAVNHFDISARQF